MQSSKKNVVIRLVLLVAISLGVSACGQVMMGLHGGVAKPAPSEFGLGPRTSDEGRYVATLAPADPLRVRKLQSVRVSIVDANGNAVEGATISVDGGMPQHGHGLPTRPRVTKALGGGVYEIDGVRFNMGGWWELKLAIAGAAGPDRITFNLAL
jgi:hypothetical protein